MASTHLVAANVTSSGVVSVDGVKAGDKIISVVNISGTGVNNADHFGKFAPSDGAIQNKTAPSNVYFFLLERQTS